jgi:hypothetical protein
MIHILEANAMSHYGDGDNGELLSYVGIVSIMKTIFHNYADGEISHQYSKDNIIILRLHAHPNFDYNIIEQYVKNNNVKILVLTLEIFDNYHRDGISIINKLADNHPNLKIIVSSYENYPSLNIQHDIRNNVFYILSSYDDIVDHSLNFVKPSNVMNYYLANLYLQFRYNHFISDLFKITYNMKRDRKYNFYNGIHKPHRLKCYEIIRNHDLLNEGFFSYLDYSNYANNPDHYNQFVNFFDFKNNDEYLKYLKGFEIPYICDSYEISPTVFVPFTLPPQIAFQSYISITTETRFTEDTNIPFSEKSFKAFQSFNIPLIFGIPLVNQYLKELGFDMFDDLFDTEPKFTKAEMFEQFEKNIKVIKNMTLKELHDFYLNNTGRLVHNFNNLNHIRKDADFNNLIDFIIT